MKSALLLTFALFLAPVHAATETESGVFEFDTRDSAGTTEALSGVFSVDVRDLGNSASEGSSVFALDTRKVSPDWLTISGNVFDSNGQPVHEAGIELRRYADVFWSGASAVDGSFSIPAQAAAGYTLVITKDGFLPWRDNLSGSGERHTNAGCKLSPKGSLYRAQLGYHCESVCL